MLRIAVIEDSKEYANLLKKKIMETDFKDDTEVDLYLDSTKFLDALGKGEKYQLCFSDIKMSGMDGVKLAEEIRENGSRMILVFISSYLEYATEGYHVKAFDYLLKGSVEAKWDALIERVIRQLEDEREKVYKITLQNSVEVIPVDCIIYIYKAGKYCNFVVDGMDKTAVRKTIKEVGEELQIYRNFIRVKRGYIINIEKIRKYTSEKVIMRNGDKLAIARMYVAKVKDLVMKYMEKL